MAPNTRVEQTKYLTSPVELADWHGFAKVEKSCPNHATLIGRPGRAGGGYGEGKAYTAAVYLYAATDNDTYAALFYATQRESVRRMLLRVALDACPGKLRDDLSCSPDYEDLMRGEGEGLSAGGGGGDFELEQITHPRILPAQGWRINSPFDW